MLARMRADTAWNGGRKQPGYRSLQYSELEVLTMVLAVELNDSRIPLAPAVDVAMFFSETLSADFTEGPRPIAHISTEALKSNDPDARVVFGEDVLGDRLKVDSNIALTLDLIAFRERVLTRLRSVLDEYLANPVAMTIEEMRAQQESQESDE